MLSICDVAPRDGLQNEDVVLTPAVRAELVRRLLDAGVAEVEVGSFVNPERVPAMAGCEEVIADLADADDARLTALVLNERGYDRLATTGLRRLRFVFTATDTFNRRNAGRSLEQIVAEACRVAGRARTDGRRFSLTIGAAFGCPYEGAVDPATVVELASQVAAVGLDELVVADTIGVAVPGQVTTVLDAVRGIAPRLGIHLHNTRNTGYSNAIAAVNEGVDLLDASVGGVGGCPFAPGAAGNIATEDIVYLLEREGIETGIDLDALSRLAVWLGERLGHEVEGKIHGVEAWWPTPRATASAPGGVAP
ncbi:MAG TPA: hydroxymethylglutaryl-CoA lyase [Solirubrobacterales bacterium]